MIRAKADGIAVGYDVNERSWFVELSGVDERDTVSGEMVLIRLTPERLVEVLVEMLRHVPERELGDAHARLVNKVNALKEGR